jgi:hypothetical protein
MALTKFQKKVRKANKAVLERMAAAPDLRRSTFKNGEILTAAHINEIYKRIVLLEREVEKLKGK